MVQQILSERNRLIQQLAQLDMVEKIYPSDANFVLVKFKNAKRVFNYLIQKQIIVRDRSVVIHCENSLRITVGTPAENDTLISALTT